MNKINYQKELYKLIQTLCKEKTVPTLLLHSCCAPCSSYCIEYLSQYFKITVFYYNPNLYPDEEYEKRVKEQVNFIDRFNQTDPVFPIKVISGDFDKESFYDFIKGYEGEPEGGARCGRCFRLRLSKTARMAKEGEFDYFATTLTISPLKNAELINGIGCEIADEAGVDYLCTDFKKKNGYKRSVELSKEYDMYRQDYCGCVYSYKKRMERR